MVLYLVPIYENRMLIIKNKKMLKNEITENEALSIARVSRSVFNRLLKKLDKKYGEYTSVKGELETFFEGKVDFNYSIDYMPGDGFLLLHPDTASVCEVEKCFEIILKNGILTSEDVLSISI